MPTLYVYCEGPSERDFVNRVLCPYLSNKGIFAIPFICTTGKKEGNVYKGGISKYPKIQKELRKICGEHKNEYVTTMIDFYGLPQDTPGIESNNIDQVKNSIMNDISANNLFVYLSKHEYEALLFSDVSCFKERFSDDVVYELRKIRSLYNTPEDINNSKDTAPSKRIQKIAPRYRKVIDGTTIAECIGIEKMIEECPYFRAWIEEIILRCR